jgi:hypothetical protein
MMGEVTHEQVNLMLRLYDTRREPLLREARSWYMGNFRPKSFEEMAKLAPMGSKQNAFVRMVLSYWEMVASIVNRGLIDEDFFFENTGEQWAAWQRVKPIAEGWRAAHRNPHMFANLEKHVQRFEAWRDNRAPGMAEAMRQMMAGLGAAAPAKSSGKKKK